MRRRRIAVLLAVVVAVGLGSRRAPLGVPLWDKSLGDVLYAVMVYLVLALARPALRPRVLGAGAFGISLAIEVFQLTGIPARMPRLLHVVFGTTFAWHDVACYVAGAAAAVLVDAAWLRRRGPQSPIRPARSP